MLRVGSGTVGRAVTSDISDTRFESSQSLIIMFTVNCIEKIRVLRKRVLHAAVFGEGQCDQIG